MSLSGEANFRHFYFGQAVEILREETMKLPMKKLFCRIHCRQCFCSSLPVGPSQGDSAQPNLTYTQLKHSGPREVAFASGSIRAGRGDCQHMWSLNFQTSTLPTSSLTLERQRLGTATGEQNRFLPHDGEIQHFGASRCLKIGLRFFTV